MNKTKTNKPFLIFLGISIVLFVLLALCYIPTSWGVQGVRDFFDMIKSLSGSIDNPGAIGWFGLEIYLIVSVIATIHFYARAKGTTSFYSSSLPKAKLVMHWAITILVSGGFIFLSNYLKDITYFL